MSRLTKSALLAAIAVGTIAPTWAQQAPGPAPLIPSQVGSVISADGPQASVIVIRGSQAYALLTGDILFDGDRIVTRSNGRVTISAHGCEKLLVPTSSLVIAHGICETKPVLVTETAGAFELLGPPLAAGAVGATPAILGTLAAAGGAAAALGGDSSSTAEVSP
jgi:hypothetical protein